MARSEKSFAVFDVDGTLIRWQLYHAIADSLVKLGFIAPVKFQSIKDARMVWKRREGDESYKEYETELMKLYQDIISEITVEQFEKTTAAVFEEYKDQVYTYTRDLLNNLKKKKYLLFAISGSQAQIISKMAEHYGFDDFVARVDEQKNHRFTGRAETPIFVKDKVLMEMVTRNGASFKSSVAVGDTATDIKMLELVENPIAFNPNRELFEYAQSRGWRIVIERKNMVYELEKGNGKYQLAKTNG